MPNMVAFEACSPGFPVRYRGFEYKFDENGLLFLHEGQSGFISFLENFPEDKIMKGGDVPKDLSKYKRKHTIKKPDIYVEDPRKVKWDFLHKYWADIKVSIADQHLDNHIRTMQHMDEQQRKAYAKQIGG